MILELQKKIVSGKKERRDELFSNQDSTGRTNDTIAMKINQIQVGSTGVFFLFPLSSLSLTLFPPYISY